MQSVLLYLHYPYHAKFNESMFIYESWYFISVPVYVLNEHMHANSFKYNSSAMQAYTSDSAFIFVA